MNPFTLQQQLSKLGFNTQLKAGFYGSQNDSFAVKNFKNSLNLVIKISGKLGLKIAHYWMLIA